jgi:alkanesulfonate monooxygenase SsuD/methylene tetrahydromethanopterin reductase-like flavin-dependent oxidoreductase (luciferase family)
MSQVQFGVSLAPRIEDLDTIVNVATAADDAGLDLLAIQDHPYVAEFVDAFSLIGHLLSRTTRIRVFPDVANLPLRPLAMLANAAATLDLLSGGRFELGLGGGASMDAVAEMGGPVRARPDALPALAEGIDPVGRQVAVGGLDPPPCGSAGRGDHRQQVGAYICACVVDGGELDAGVWGDDERQRESGV